MRIEDATRGYFERIQSVARVAPHLLAAHAYVRYLGDLSGGGILRDVVRKQFALAGRHGTRFYEFGDAREADRLAREFREGLDRIPLKAGGAAAIVAEARRAFAAHVRLFEALDDAG
jgi:heme oxygenase